MTLVAELLSSEKQNKKQLEPQGRKLKQSEKGVLATVKTKINRNIKSVAHDGNMISPS